VQHWVNRCEMRRVNLRAVLDKLAMLRDSGVDIDRIPLSVSVGEILRFSVPKIRAITEGDRYAAN